MVTDAMELLETSGTEQKTVPAGSSVGSIEETSPSVLVVEDVA